MFGKMRKSPAQRSAQKAVTSCFIQSQPRVLQVTEATSLSDRNTYVHVDTSASASGDDKATTQVRCLNTAHPTWQHQNYSKSLLEIENKIPIFHSDFFIVLTSIVVCTAHIPSQNISRWLGLSCWQDGETPNGELITTRPYPELT